MKWLHVSEYYLGMRKTFYPRIPESGVFDIGEDKTTPRICVSDSIKKCVLGMYGSVDLPKNNMIVYVYRLQGKAFKPTIDQVPDQLETNEHWILKKKYRISG